MLKFYSIKLLSQFSHMNKKLNKVVFFNIIVLFIPIFIIKMIFDRWFKINDLDLRNC